jgi:voltage-gated potassium channel
MFAASLLFLVCLAGTFHLSDHLPLAQAVCQYGLFVLYPAFILEWLIHLSAGSQHTRQNLLFCFIPPLRLGARDHAEGKLVWLPGRGWAEVNRELQQKLEKAFSLPMIGIALMVLPLVLIEPPWSEQAADSKLVAFTQPAAALIWLAFAFEFLLMISITERKVRYFKEHWIDVAVILLPLVTFLQVARLGRLARLTRTARVYRMRGLLMRLYRAVLLLDVVDRLIRGDGEKRLARLQQQLLEKELEIEEIRREIQRLQAADDESVLLQQAA